MISESTYYAIKDVLTSGFVNQRVTNDELFGVTYRCYRYWTGLGMIEFMYDRESKHMQIAKISGCCVTVYETIQRAAYPRLLKVAIRVNDRIGLHLMVKRAGEAACKSLRDSGAFK